MDRAGCRGGRCGVNRLSARKRLQLAFRERASIVGILLSCMCEFPNEKYETSSEHSQNCPAHRMIASRDVARATREEAVRP